MSFSIIVAVDKEWGIGRNNQLLAHLPSDLKWFKKNTLEHTVIMGRITYESIGKALPRRRNIVLSRSLSSLPDAQVAHSLEQVIQFINPHEENFIIGGAQIYRLFLPLTDKLYITHIHASLGADTFFPEIDMNKWEKIYEYFNPADEKNPYDHTFAIYKLKKETGQ